LNAQTRRGQSAEIENFSTVCLSLLFTSTQL
jgi:hypothetical protein